MTTIGGTSTPVDYTSLTEFTAYCDDKFGNRSEINVTIYSCFQHQGAVFIRVIRCVPLASHLESQGRYGVSEIAGIPQPDIPASAITAAGMECDIVEFAPQPKRQKLSDAPQEISDVTRPCYSVTDSSEVGLPWNDFFKDV